MGEAVQEVSVRRRGAGEAEQGFAILNEAPASGGAAAARGRSRVRTAAARWGKTCRSILRATKPVPLNRVEGRSRGPWRNLQGVGYGAAARRRATRRRSEGSSAGMPLQREDGHRTPWAAGIVLLAAGIFLVHAMQFRAFFHGYGVDDAYISFRFARNLLDGHGLAFNPGEPIEGYSNFLWVLAMTPVLAAGGDPAHWAQYIALAASVTTLVLVDRAITRMFGVRDRALRAVALLLLAGSGYFAGWSVSGLETNVFALLLLVAWMRFVVETGAPARRRPVSALLFVVLALLRPEGVPIAVVAVIARLLLERRRHPSGEPARRFRLDTIAFVTIVCGALLAYEIWRFSYFGPHLLPNSVRAKVGGGLQQLVSGLSYLCRFFFVPYLPLLGAFVLAAPRWRKVKAPQSVSGSAPHAAAAPGSGSAAMPTVLAAASGVALTLGYLLFVAAVGGDWSYGRLFVPLLPVAVVTAVGLLGSSAQWPAWTRSRRRQLVLASLALVYLAWAWDVTSRQREARRWEAWWKVDAERIAIAKTFAEIMPKDAVIAVYAAGEIPYFSGLRAHDMLGLNDPHIGSLSMPEMGRGVPGHEKWDARYTLEVVRPDIIVEGRLVPGLNDHPIRRRDYHRVEGLSQYQEVLFHRRIIEYLQANGKLPTMQQ